MKKIIYNVKLNNSVYLIFILFTFIFLSHIKNFFLNTDIIPEVNYDLEGHKRSNL